MMIPGRYYFFTLLEIIIISAIYLAMLLHKN